MSMLLIANYITKLYYSGYIIMPSAIEREKGVDTCPICDCKNFYNLKKKEDQNFHNNIFLCLRCGPYKANAADSLNFFPVRMKRIPDYDLSSYLRQCFESRTINDINNIKNIESKDTLDSLTKDANANIPEFSEKQYYLLRALKSLQKDLGEKIYLNSTNSERKKEVTDGSPIDILDYKNPYHESGLKEPSILKNYLMSFSYLKNDEELDCCLKNLQDTKCINYEKDNIIEILPNGYEYLENNKIKDRTKSDKSISDKIIKSQELYNIGNKLINENIEKCDKKIKEGDSTGAITNARSLLETLLLSIYRQIKKEDYNTTGNLNKLYKEVSKLIDLNIEKDMKDNKKQVLSGLISIISGISEISNEMSDRHGRLTEYDNRELKRISILAVNSVKTISLYLNNDIL